MTPTEREWREAFDAYMMAPVNTPAEKLAEMFARTIAAGDAMKALKNDASIIRD